MDAAPRRHHSPNSSELMTRRKSVTHPIDNQGCDERRVVCVCVLPRNNVFTQSSHKRGNLSPLNSEPIHLTLSTAENRFQLASRSRGSIANQFYQRTKGGRAK